jgi:hypothetical protein
MRMLVCGFEQFTQARVTATLVAFRIPAPVVWPYFAAAALLAIGLPIIIKHDLPQTHGLDKAVPFGRLFFAIPMGVFGTARLTDAQLDARTLILGLSGGHCSDCRSSEHRRHETGTFGGNTFGNHDPSICGYDSHSQHSGQSAR